MLPLRFAALIGALVSAATLVADPSDSLPLTDFGSPTAATSWRAINDTVMGGRSRGGPQLQSDSLVFSGEISLANRGGFSSVRSKGPARDLSAYEGLELLIKGDGRPYWVTMNTRARHWWMEVYYWTQIQPAAGGWSIVRVPFTRFTPSVHGRTICGHALDTRDIRSIGLMLYDKKAGPFRVELGAVRAYRKGSAAPPENDIVATASAAGQFNTLLAAAKAAGLVEALRGRGPLTVLAPNDQAFAQLPAGTVENLLEPAQRDLLVRILTLHVIPGAVELDAALAAREAKTLEGGVLSFRRDGERARVGEATIVAANLRCSNGVVHVIDRVILPTPPAKPEPTKTQPEVAEPRIDAAKSLIELAVKRGVPLFNAGQPAACQAVYELTVSSLLEMNDPRISEAVRRTLREALEQSQRDAPDAAAWRLRRGLDAAYAALSP